MILAADDEEETLSVGAKAAIAASVVAPALFGLCLLKQKLDYICDLFSMQIFTPKRDSVSEETKSKANSETSDTLSGVSLSEEDSVV